MEPIEFWKMSGTGNDFILIDNRQGLVKEDDMSRLVSRSCRRRESVGADGVIFVTDSKEYDFGWRYFHDGGFPTNYTVVLYPDRKKMVPFPDPVDAVAYMNNL